MSLSSLAGPRGYRLGVLAAFAIALPALGFGFFADDYLHFTAIRGQNDIASPCDIYVFGTGDEEQMRPYLETGPYPWFMDSYFKAHFFRPLSSLLMTLDYRFFGFFSPAYYAHSILWYLLLCFGVMLILRRSLPPAVGVLALFLFVLDESHALPVSWWSNRNSVVAVALGFLGVAAHLRWREDHWRPGLPLSLAAYTGALLGSENGLGPLAYVLAYELFAARGLPWVRFRCVMPAALLALAYFILYRMGGYGARFSDIYIDPGADPLRYLAVAPFRFVMLSGAQFFMLPCEMILLRPGLASLFVVLGACALAIVALALRLVWPGLDAAEHRALRWLIPGALLAVAPSLAAIVTSRVLLSSSLGGAAIIAVVIVHSWRLLCEGTAPPAVRRLLRPLMHTFLVLHLGVAALFWPGQVLVIRGVMHHLNGIIRSSEIDEARIQESQLVIVNAPDPYTGLYPVMLRYFDGLPQARSWWTLSIAPFAHRLTRIDDRHMELEIVGGQLFTSPMERLFRSARRPLRPGDYRDLDGLIITVLETGGAGPSRMRLEFAESPESDRYQILVFLDGGFRRIQPPSAGETLELPYALP